MAELRKRQSKYWVVALIAGSLYLEGMEIGAAQEPIIIGSTPRADVIVIPDGPVGAISEDDLIDNLPRSIILCPPPKRCPVGRWSHPVEKTTPHKAKPSSVQATSLPPVTQPVSPEPTATLPPVKTPTQLVSPEPTAKLPPVKTPTQLVSPEPTAKLPPVKTPTQPVAPEPTATLPPVKTPTQLVAPEPTATLPPVKTPTQPLSPEPTATLPPVKTPTQPVSPEPTATLPLVKEPAASAEITPLKETAREEASILVFTVDQVDLSDNHRTILRAVIDRLKKRQQNAQLRSYASAKSNDASTARRISLQRALNVRSFLTGQGITDNRIIVRALGSSPKAPVTDGVVIDID